MIDGADDIVGEEAFNSSRPDESGSVQNIKPDPPSPPLIIKESTPASQHCVTA